jgi:hypothetical protein
MTRIFIPKIGSKVKLQEWEHYNQLDEEIRDWRARFQKTADECRASVDKGLISSEQSKAIYDEVYAQYCEYCKTRDVPSRWAWFEVLEVKVAPEPEPSNMRQAQMLFDLALGEGRAKVDASSYPAGYVKLRHTSRAVNAPDPAWEGWVPLEQIDAPLGWKPVYEIVCKDKEQADKVVNEWFKLGIHVWTSADLSSAGRKSFTPFGAAGATQDSPASPHWQYMKEPTESIPPELCPQLFVVKVFEEWEPKLPESRKEKAAAVKALRESGVEVEYIKGEHMWVAMRETLVYQPEVIE